MNQREMPMMAGVRGPVMASRELIEMRRNRLEAIQLCVQLSGLSNEYICSHLGIDRGHWTRMMQGRAYFPDTKSIELMQVCGNYAPLQYEAWAMGFELQERSKDARIRELEKQLQKLKGEVAA